MISSYSFKKLVYSDKFLIKFYEPESNEVKTFRCEIKDSDLGARDEYKIHVWDIENKKYLLVDTNNITYLKLENGTIFNKKDLYKLAYKLGELVSEKIDFVDEELMSEIKDAVSIFKKTINPRYGNDI